LTRIVDEGNREFQALGRLATLQGQRVLDIGCGDGRLSLLMAEVAQFVVGIDPYAEAVAEARRRAGPAPAAAVSFLLGDVNTVSEPWANEFDVVVFSRSL